MTALIEAEPKIFLDDPNTSHHEIFLANCHTVSENTWLSDSRVGKTEFFLKHCVRSKNFQSL